MKNTFFIHKVGRSTINSLRFGYEKLIGHIGTVTPMHYDNFYHKPVETSSSNGENDLKDN